MFEPAAIQGIRFVAGKQQFVPEVTYPPTQPENDQTSGKQMRDREEKKQQHTLECFCSYVIIHVVLFASFESSRTLERGKVQIVFHLVQREGKNIWKAGKA